jgi:hypothetical protein
MQIFISGIKEGKWLIIRVHTRKFKRCGNLVLEFDIFRMLWNGRKIAITSFYISERNNAKNCSYLQKKIHC